jgi:hypothetical protein
MTEVTIVSSWWDAGWFGGTEVQVVAVYADRGKAEAWVATQQKQARENPALIAERDHKHWLIKVYRVIE